MSVLDDMAVLNGATVELVGTRLVEAIDSVARDLLTQGLDNGEEELIPVILLPLAVMALCRRADPETVMELLESMRLKVERGDFHSDPDSGQTPPKAWMS
ncbi:MAG: hypothetical protein LBP92_10740 [Deltaproteobacteria bacterium]|jgi:hypothetical protein|nr:hypothetical protein [Deltaproteobacteria bacterium]